MAPLEYLRFFGRLLGMGGTDLEARAEDLVREYGLQGHAELPARALSKGLRRRLELARTLLPDPPVLILDEPASGLDPSSSVALNQELLSLKRERTVLVSTHLLLDADRLCDDVVIMNEGRVVTAGPKDVLKEALAAERRYVLEVLGKEPTGKDLEIEGLPGDRWQVVYRGTPAGFAALTGRLSRSGEVVRVSVEEPGLDDVFFREIGGVDAPSP
jgi:ABC-2 type transport system ATP-binding protein